MAKPLRGVTSLGETSLQHVQQVRSSSTADAPLLLLDLCTARLPAFFCVTLVEEMVALPRFCFGIGPSPSAGLCLDHHALPLVHWPRCSIGSSIPCPLRHGV